MDEFGSNNVDAGQVGDTGRERGRYGLSNWNSGGGSGVTGGASRGVGGMRLVFFFITRLIGLSAHS